MERDTRIAPCPFCRRVGQAEVREVDSMPDGAGHVPVFAACCSWCGARGPMAFKVEDAAWAWNRAAESGSAGDG